MSAFQATIAVMVLLTIPVVITGLARRHRLGVAYTFVFYLLAVFVSELLIVGWQSIFYKRWFYLQKENAITAFRFAVALELMYRTFRAFPSAHRTARLVFLALVSATLVVVVSATGDQPDTLALVNKVQPRVISATVWLVTALAALILWYRLPVESFHKAILLGWVPYLLIFSAALNFVGDYGLEFRVLTNYVHTIAFLGLLVYWARAAWAPVAVHVSALPQRSMTLERKAS